VNPLTDYRIQQCTDYRRRLGATFVPGEGVHTRLWAPDVGKAQIIWNGGEPSPLDSSEGYFTGHFPDRGPGDKYMYVLDGKTSPDPASRYQPEDVFGPSAVVATEYGWQDAAWKGIPYGEWVIYEVHAGAFSSRHDFQGIIEDLPRLKSLGITTIELMPVSQFSGARNWGYDGVFPHAVQHSYGGPQALKALVDACHAAGLAIILDVVYNHLGPEGNTLFACGPYTNEKYTIPWGVALNFDGPENDHVRHYFLQTVWQWLTEYHFDGLRLDAVQMIFDNAPITFLEEVSRLKTAAEERMGRPLILIAESDMNDPRLLAAPDQNGHGMDAQWADDFHHALHVTLTGEKDGYYADYGGTAQLARIYREGVAFAGDYSPFRRRRHGKSYHGIARNRLIAELQNHDQVGNRLKGDRVDQLITQGRSKLAAAAVLLSPFTPLIFMGEEFASKQPFSYFVSHHSKKLLEAMREGRKKEWEAFGWRDEAPDPGAPETFEACVLHDKVPAPDSPGDDMFQWYKSLIALSREIRLWDLGVHHDAGQDLIVLRYRKDRAEVTALLNFGEQPATHQFEYDAGAVILNSRRADAPVENGIVTLQPYSVLVYRK